MIDLSKLPVGTKVKIFGDRSTNIEHIEHYHEAEHQYDTSVHPLATYVMRVEKAEKIIEWMRHVIHAQTTVKDQLAPLKAALECEPKAIMFNVTVDAYNREFGLTISPAAFDDWIKGYHGKQYEEKDIADYIDVLNHIMAT